MTIWYLSRHPLALHAEGQGPALGSDGLTEELLKAR